LISQEIYSKEGGEVVFKSFSKFQSLHEAIQEYYIHAFSPEIIHALQFVRESKLAAELLSKYAKASGEQKESIAFSESRFQTNLLYIQKNFENALSSLKLKRNNILFIDGIDIRPASIPYEDYIECIKGLANAVWEVNNDFFSKIKDSKGRMRVVLLVRPDIYASLGLQNQNTKIRDNSILLNWTTTYKDHRRNDLFSMADQLLAYQQPEFSKLSKGQAWDYYFPWDSPTETASFEKKTSFISFLRFSLYRPRDIVTMLTMLQERFKSSNDQFRQFSQADFDDSTFRRSYADYLLGEVKDQLAFYYSEADYDDFLKFFTFLDGKNKFTYKQYLEAYAKHEVYLSASKRSGPKFMSSADEFLQFLYELNVISYFEQLENGEKYIHWCFRDRTYSNISPKVKSGEEYEIFYGMSKALNTGTHFKKR
uniref:P-loop ATPase, Sll1717 family n=1 Tax=uncultured Nevskia sp. TaxID=228950 RepID=UPI0025CD3B98